MMSPVSMATAMELPPPSTLSLNNKSKSQNNDRHTAVCLLYLDENLPLSQLFQRQLTPHGYQIELAHNGQQGWRLLQQNQYDILAIDYNLPLINGLELIQRLPETGQTPPATILLIRPGQEKYASQALQAGASDYLIKDTAGRYLELLPAVMAKLVRQRQMAQEHAQLFAQLHQRTKVLDLLNQATQQLTSTLNVQKVIAQIMDSTIAVLGVQGCSLWLWDESHHYLVCHAVSDRYDVPPLKGLKVMAERGVVGWVASHKQSEIVRQTTADRRFLPEIDQQINYKTESLLAVPLQVRDEVIGVLEVVNKESGEFSPEDLAVAQTLAASAATALQNARLVQALRQRTADLEERNGELDAFAHTVAHDLQNLLARVVGFAELLTADLHLPQGLQDGEGMSKTAALIANNGRKMSSIIEALLLLASVRDATVQMSPLAMGQVVQEAWQRVADESAVEVRLLQPDPASWPMAWGYAPWVEEVWFNYLSNAVKYGGSSGVVTVGATAVDNPDNPDTPTAIRYWVVDNGPGITPADQERLFTPFATIGQTTKGGHGLGLSIVQRIVTKMGGQVGVESSPEGSLFYFTLPADRPEKRI